VRDRRFEGWEAKHPIVMLSACETALGKTFDGGSYGMARAMFAAGAAQVVASLWNVDDEATRLLMTDFMDHMFIGFETEDAMAVA
jgi:CHAT domain-containing protein